MDALPERIPHLAPLTAAGKVENRMRNAIASFLRDHVRADGYTVRTNYPARELDRDEELRDLAVLDGNDTTVLELEAKAIYSFDVLDEGRRRAIRGDKASDIRADWPGRAVEP